MFGEPKAGRRTGLSLLFGESRGRRDAPPQPKRLVVYTCLFGRYEPLNEQPIAKSSKVDFVCLTDREDLTSETWEIRKIETLGLDGARESRRPKLLPELFFPDYEASIYIDNSVVLTVEPERIATELLTPSSTGFVCFRHPDRDCIYEEAEVICQGAVDDEVRVREQMDFYLSKGHPAHAGLIAGTFLLRRHGSPVPRQFGEQWFAHVLRFSKRDQLSFNYLSRRCGLPYDVIDRELNTNEFFHWPVISRRLPYNFDPDMYLWLNPDVARAGVEPALHYVNYGADEGRIHRYHPHLELEILANKHKTDKGRLYYNRHFYSRIYEHYLRDLRNSRFSLLEIGLLRHDIQARNPNGPFDDAPSLKMWSEYFAEADIHGFDIQDFSAVQGGRIHFTRGDQSKPNDLLNAVSSISSPLRVIIDDGSHASHHQQISLGTLFRHLEPGGLYFIEDLHYQPSSLELPGAVKTLDVLKALAQGRDARSDFIPEAEMDGIRGSMASIEFHDSMDFAAPNLGTDAMAVIRKR
jgi:hypothetical protein